MGDVVNLKRHRKRKARAEKDELAAHNRIKFGRTKAERKTLGAVKALDIRRHDGHKRGEDE